MARASWLTFFNETFLPLTNILLASRRLRDCWLFGSAVSFEAWLERIKKIYFSVTKTVTFELVQWQVVFTCHIHKLLPYSANILFLGVGKRTQYSPHKMYYISENREYPSSHIFLGETPIKRIFFNNVFKNRVWNAKFQNYDKALLELQTSKVERFTHVSKNV